MSERVLALALLIQLGLAGVGAAQDADPGPVRVGDRWSYNVTDAITGDLKLAATLVVAEIGDREITVRSSLRGGKVPPQTVVYDPDWNRIDETSWKFRPNDGLGVRRPLRVGMAWRSDSHATHLQSGTVLRRAVAAKVAAREQVTTAAGTFDTFRIEFAVREVNTRDQTRSASVNHVVWYAPAVNRWVKRKVDTHYEGRLRDSFIEELTEYSRRP